ncbi:hypothetical protein BHM03_00043142 [Ensete ventricosum]|nr:hypothetical protein BHM03_00043142 [Ensete ventricosum]
MDLSDLCGMSKVSGWKPPATCAVVPAREVSGTPSNKAPRSSSKRPYDGSTPQSDDPTRKYKKVKVLSRRHKSHRDEGGSRSHSKGKEPTRSVEELEALEESAEEIVAPIFRCLKSMDLCGTSIRKDDEGVTGEVGAANEFDQDLGRLEVRKGVRKGTSTSVVGEGVVHAPVRGAPRPSCQGDGPARGDFSDAQRELKEAWVKAHRADDDDLLKSVKELERV